MNRSVVVTGSVFILLGIVLGAFGAHALKEVLEEVKLISYETGVRYLIYHGLALLIMGLSSDKLPSLKWPTRLIITGVLFFSGSIFFLALQEPMGATLKFLGPVTPIGGVFMIAGWGLLIKNLLLEKK